MRQWEKTRPGRICRPYAAGIITGCPLDRITGWAFRPRYSGIWGILWLVKILYPDAADYDLYTEIARYFRLFYGCDLSQAQFDALVDQSR